MSEYQQKVAVFLAQIGAEIGQELSLSEAGVCGFDYQNLTVVIEIPDFLADFFIYTELVPDVFTLPSPASVLKKCLTLNYLQQETDGGCLSLVPDGSALVFSHIYPLHDMTAQDFCDALEKFLQTALQIQEKITLIDSQRADDEGFV